MDLATIAIGTFGLFSSVVTAVLTWRDADRVGVSRPRLWMTATSGTLVTGFGLFLFTSAPIPGVIMGSIVGPVLYAFEREATIEDGEPPSPGRLPYTPAETGGGERESEADGE